MNRIARWLLLAPLFTLVACTDLGDGGGVPTASYRRLGDLSVTYMGGASTTPNGDLILPDKGRIYRWQRGTKSWVNLPRAGLPDANFARVETNTAGDYLALADGKMYTLLSGQTTWTPALALPDTAPAYAVAFRLTANGTVYVLSNNQNAQKLVSVMYRKPFTGGSWTKIYDSTGSTAVALDIQYVYPSGDVWVSGQNLQGNFLLRATTGKLEPGFDCTGNAVRPYCEFGVAKEGDRIPTFAPNGDLFLTYGGLGTNSVFRARVSSGFPLRPEAIGSLPSGAISFNSVVALNDSTLIGSGDQPTPNLFRLKPGSAQWEDLGERPMNTVYTEMIANNQGEVFFFGRQCCFFPVPVFQLSR